MAQPNFRVVDSNREHARDIARLEAKRFMLDREKDGTQTICNQHGEVSARPLWVDDILRKADLQSPEVRREPYQPHPFLIRFLAFALIVGVIVTVILFW